MASGVMRSRPEASSSVACLNMPFASIFLTFFCTSATPGTRCTIRAGRWRCGSDWVPAEHERTTEHGACGDERHGSRKLDGSTIGDKRDSHGNACDHKRYVAATRGRGARIAKFHELLFALALLNERVLLLTSADAVRGLRNPAADALSGGTGNALDGRLEVAEIARLHGVLRSICNLIGHVI